MSFVEPSTSVLLQEAKPTNRNTIIAAFSNLSTAFNLININLAHVIMQNQYCGGDNCKAAVTSAGTACLAGAIVGQLTFGYIGDCLGRGPALQLTMLMSIVGALASAFAVPMGSEGQTVFTFILVTRLILGMGVGGVYPLAATLSQESGDEKTRGRNAALVFSMQGIGAVSVPVVGLIFLTIFGNPETRIADDAALPGIAWRLLLGIGALPGILLAPFKTQKKTIAVVAAPAANDSQEVPKMTLFQALATPGYLWKLCGTAGGWFIFDITFYGNTIFQPTVLKSIFHVEGDVPTNGQGLAHNLCYQLLILALIGLPGYYVSVCFMDSWGRKRIQLMGFSLMAILYGILAIWIDDLPPAVLLIIYGLTFFFSNFGPNATTFILPAETFPAEVRSTLNGFSAACGKAGAVVGSAAFKPIASAGGNGTAMALCAVCSLLGCFVTAVFVEDRRGKGMAGTSMVEANAKLTKAGSAK